MWSLTAYRLKRSLNKVCNNLNRQLYINFGGCCFISYLIASHLDKLNIPYSLLIFSDFKKNKNEITAEVRNMKKSKESNNSVSGKYTCTHYCIYIHNVGIINEGKYKECARYKISNISSKNINWIYRTGNWNNKYDNINNYIVAKIINEVFAPYEKSNILRSKNSKVSKM